VSGFEDFWAAYPRKVGKLAALREWQKLNPSDEVQRQMAAALEWQRAQWDDPQYIPHPRTWLHAGRWLDEPPETARPVPKNLVGIDRWMQQRRAGNE
jgi:hypothetical protein